MDAKPVFVLPPEQMWVAVQGMPNLPVVDVRTEMAEYAVKQEVRVGFMGQTADASFEIRSPRQSHKVALAFDPLMDLAEMHVWELKHWAEHGKPKDGMALQAGNPVIYVLHDLFPEHIDGVAGFHSPVEDLLKSLRFYKRDHGREPHLTLAFTHFEEVPIPGAAASKGESK